MCIVTVDRTPFITNIKKFQTLCPFDQQITLCKYQKKAGNWLQIGSFAIHIYGGTPDSQKRSQAYIIYSIYKFIFDRYYQKRLSSKKPLPEVHSNNIQLKYNYFCKYWMKKRPKEQFKDLYQLFLHINYISIPILNNLAEQLQKAIYKESSLKIQLSSMFILKEITAQFKLPVELQIKIIKILQKIAKEKADYQVRELALESLSFLGLSYWKEKIKAQIIVYIKYLSVFFNFKH